MMNGKLQRGKPKNKIKMEITKEKFNAYERVRESGVTNMFMITNVMNISGLTKEECLEIMKNYSELEEKFSEDKI